MCTGVITPKRAMQNMDWTCIFMIGGMNCVSAAVIKAGGGDLIAQFAVKLLGESPNPYVLGIFVMIITCVMTQFLSNVSTVAIMAPISALVAQGCGVNPTPIMMMIAFAGNAAYMTPIGASAVTIIYGHGGYKFTDFVKPGFFLNLITLVLAVILCPVFWPF